MRFTSMIFVLVVILINSLFNFNVLASSVIETTKNDVCSTPCTRRYGTYECWHDCLHERYNDGGCVDGRCCCKK
ncbi:hypothetical protein ISN44_As02g002830 [Arabidopsis suecica]|uniref:Putative defensin-like protein 57 n=2 Tax=Arabidopsis TaxID=3701 RepID=DEF57_ARATH|nr:Cysteine-rich protein [Arabidopsis thaliana]Q2V4A8.1 RecName: Full=Putative defensin-like protein 57; Flags: Precursor [Arabidopsis thaliana]AEC05765.1 Cysteine-rich protein [Arabidopsis thaliana]KAG7640440.1 hypothetical protein ISN44_As02g002830 [Arabidopsis suecica]|eukprot:NP_001030967.1 Cysteine-rich protein [Arabidopsis thaliana]